VASGAAPFLPPDPIDPFAPAAFSRDGTRFVTALNTARLYDMTGTKGIEIFNDNSQAPFTSAAISPDGPTVITGTDQGMVQVRDATTGRKLTEWRVANGTVLQVAVSHDGKRVVTLSHTEARLWEIATREEVARLESPQPEIRSVAFSPDGRRIITASDIVRVWPAFLKTQDLVDYAREVMPRALTAEQREQYFLDPSAASPTAPASVLRP
jgi:WD40 repeat protein